MVVVEMLTLDAVASSVLSLISAVVTFKNVVVVGGVVKTPGVVALKPVVSSLGRRGAAKEEERGRRNKKESISILFPSFLDFLFSLGISFLLFWTLALSGNSGLLLMCKAQMWGYIPGQDLPEERPIK